jgi:hypothetical protein
MCAAHFRDAVTRFRCAATSLGRNLGAGGATDGDLRASAVAVLEDTAVPSGTGGERA